MDQTRLDCLKQLDELLAASNQSWLFGAGISLNAGVPLMWPLTERVFALAETEGEASDKAVLDFLKEELADDSHIEHILSQLGDYRAIAERSKNSTATFGGITLDLPALDEFHQRILGWIAETVRWGYKAAAGGDSEKVGSREDPIVTVDEHKGFVSALFNRTQAGVAERRRAVRLFTTNYDTLLEDGLALERFPYWDGFSGGAVAFRSHRYGDDEPQSFNRAHVIKLHGSIDWHLGDDDHVWRVRDGDCYPKKRARVLIYPQSMKYLATQRDPFAAQFDLFRKCLASREENVLATCGYSFGDEHINQEIELALQRPENKTTILAFTSKTNQTLDAWRNAAWGRRVYVITEDGVFVGPDGPEAPPAAGSKHTWWTFAGVTGVLNNGAESFLS
jgi:hypothetical protein